MAPWFRWRRKGARRTPGGGWALLALAIFPPLVLLLAAPPAAAQSARAPSEPSRGDTPVAAARTAPQWQSVSPSLLLTTGLAAPWQAAWSSVPGARGYLVEVAGDPSFDKLQYEPTFTLVPAFHGYLSPGQHHVRVRAQVWDVAPSSPSASRPVHVLGLSAEPPGLALQAGALVLEPCTELRISGAEGVEVARGEGPFAPLQARVPVDARLGGTWRLRAAGDEALTLAVRVTAPHAVVRATRRPDGVRVVAVVDNLAEEHQRCLALTARAVGAGPEGAVLLVDRATGARTAILPASQVDEGSTAIEVLDARGIVVGSAPIAEEVVLPAPAPPPRLVLGTVLPPLALSPRTDVPWSAPTAPFAVGFSGAVGFEQGGQRGVGRVLVQGSWEFLSLDATWRTPEPEQRRQEELTWIGARARVYEADGQAFALGLITRIGLPLIEGGRARLEGSLALGGADETGSWLVNVGGRPRLGPHHDMANDIWSLHLSAGGTLRPVPWLRLFAVGTVQMILLGEYSGIGYEGVKPPPDAAVGMPVTEWATGAELQVGPVLFGPHVIAAMSPKWEDFEPDVGLQLWVGYVPRL